MTQIETLGPAAAPEFEMLLDWQGDSERLRRAAEEAEETGQADPLALAEAECSLDLIDAEIAALKHRQDPAAAGLRKRLTAWRAEIALAASTLARF